MAWRGVVIETLHRPEAYSAAQLKEACEVGRVFKLPRYTLTIKPDKCPRCLGDTETFCTACGSVA